MPHQDEILLREIFGEPAFDPEPPMPEWMVKANTTIAPHEWQWCGMCEWHVKCGYCGNNCCNGGSGRTVFGKDCNCDEAYELQSKVSNVHPES